MPDMIDAIAGTPLAAGFVLVSWWKALVFLPPVVVWAIIISNVYDKHAARFHLARERWNTAHLIVGAVAVLIGMYLPVLAGLEGILGLLVGWFAMVLMLVGDLVSYPMVANKDPRVPEGHHVRINLDSFKEARARKVEAKQAGTAELVIMRADKSKVLVPNRDTPEFALRLSSEQVVLKGLNMRAAQMDILPTGRDGMYGVRYLVDGVAQAGDTFAQAEAARIIDFWRDAATMDLSDRRKQQIGMVKIMRGEQGSDLRVMAIGGQGGLRLSIKVNPALAVRRSADTLGLIDAQRQALDEIVGDGRGVVLLASPAGQGRTTTLYTLIKMHDAYTRNVQTLEFEIEDGLEGTKQNVFDRTSEDQEFSKNLRSILRRDPNVVGVAEVPDRDTALEITRGDMENARVYASLRAPDAMHALQLWIRLLGDQEVAAKHLHGVLASRLVRKLCENCRVPYQPTPEMLKKLGLPADKVKQLFKKGGQVLVKNKPEVCPVCNGLGYAGQEGVFEVYPIGSEERELIRQGNLQGLRAELRKRKHLSIQQVALRKAVDGVTSVEEVLRIASSGEEKAKSAGEPAASGA